jgi:hypothetical protein
VTNVHFFNLWWKTRIKININEVVKMKRLVSTTFAFFTTKAFMAAILLLLPGMLMAEACMQDNYQASDPKLANKTLGCTANDIQVAEVTQIIPVSGIFTENGKLFCYTGTQITFNANFEVVLTAQDRFDIGLYLSKDGTSALTGDCNAEVITADNNKVNYLNNDDPPDACGDIAGPIGSTYNPQDVNMTVTVACDGNGSVQIPNCSSWRQPGANDVCTGIEDAVPGTSSKCECGLITVPIEIEEPTLNIVKSANPTEINEPGGDVKYTVVISNPAVSTAVELTKLEDDQNLVDGVTSPDDASYSVDFTFTPSAEPYLVCDRLTLEPCGLDANNCAENSQTSCTFTLPVTGNAGDEIKDLACIYGTAVNSNTSLDPVCDAAAVKIKDVGPSATVWKRVKGVECADIIYEVEVENLSTAEAATLVSLGDSAFGFLNGQGTCETPQTLAIGGKYDCQFTATLCYPEGELPNHDNKVTATVSDDDGNTVYPEASIRVIDVKETTGSVPASGL